MASLPPPPVRILNVCRVPLPPPPHPPPGDTLPLSLFDAFWISLPPIQRLFLYPDAGPLPFSALVGSLRSALARTLPLFHPFAGELAYRPTSGDAVIDCSPSCFAGAGPGVALVAAESDAEVRRLAREEAHDMESFLRLVPELGADELPAAVMAVQVTAFAAGGVALGIAAHHVVADGKGLWLFVEALAAACKGEEAQAEGAAAPSHDRAAIRVLGGDEIARRYMKLLAPALPRIRSPADPSAINRRRLARRTFVLDPATIQSIKQRALRQSTTTMSSCPSTFVALSAHAWVSVAKAKGFHHDNGPIVFVFLADCRARLVPPVGDAFTGNCVSLCFARATGRELAGGVDGLAQACIAIQRAVREAAEEPLKGCERWIDEYLSLPKERIAHVAGSPRFKVYETDFGWGRPGRVELVSMNHDGEVVLVGGEEEGSVQASVALARDQMEEFVRAFLGGDYMQCG